MTTPKITAADILERAAAAVGDISLEKLHISHPNDQATYLEAAKDVLAALPVTLDQLAAIANGESKVMPRKPTDAMRDDFSRAWIKPRGQAPGWDAGYEAMIDGLKETPAGICELCGQTMPPGEEMFRFHGYSGPCPDAAPAPAREGE